MNQTFRPGCILLVLLAVMVSGPVAFAMPEPPTPRQILERAAEGRIALIEILNDMERVTPTLSTREQTFAYLRLLNDLEPITARYDLASWGADPLSNTGEVVAAHAMRWIDLSGDDWPLIAAFLRWANDQVRYGVPDLQVLPLSRTKDKARLFVWMDNLRRSRELLKAVDTDMYVLLQWDNLEETIVKKALRLEPALSQEEVTGLIAGISSIDALAEVSSFLQGTVSGDVDAVILARAVDMALALDARIRDLDFLIPAYLEDGPGLALQQIIQRLIDSGHQLDPGRTERMLAILLPKHRIQLAELLLGLPRDLLQPAQAGFLWTLVIDTVGILESLGIRDRARRMRDLANHLAGLRILASQDLEGVYRIVIGGRSGYFTLAGTGESSYVAAIHGPFGVSADVPWDYPFFDVTFDPATNMFEARRVAASSPQYAVNDAAAYFTRFRFEQRQDGVRIGGVFSNGDGMQPLTGRRVQGFTEAVERPDAGGLLSEPIGVYPGRLSNGSGERPARLTIARMGRRLSGTLIIDRFRTRVDFNYGHHDADNDSFILLSGDHFNRSTWVMVRGQLTPRGLQADYVVGGRPLERFSAKRAELAAR